MSAPRATIPKVHAPVASKPSLLTPCYDIHDCGCSALPSLEDLINDCFLESVGQKIKSTITQDFTDYVAKAHCEENLHFLVEIYKYEAYYNKIFPNNKEKLNNTPVKLLLSDLEIRPPRRGSRSSKFSVSRTLSFDDPTMMFVQSIDDLGGTHDISQAWENLRNTVDLLDEESLPDPEEEPAEATLVSQWRYIIDHFITDDAPEQINIPQQISMDIMSEDSKDSTLVHPTVFRNVRQEVLQLLQENVYYKFAKKFNKQAKSPPVTEKSLSPSTLKKKKTKLLRQGHNECTCSALSSPSLSLSNFWGHLKFYLSIPNTPSHLPSPVQTSEDLPVGSLRKFWSKKRS